MYDFGELKTIPLHKVFKHEENDFTPWLAEHIDKLGDALGMDLEVVDREAPVGDFFLDLLAQVEGTSRTVVIENQFKRSNHEHLGKLLTYAGGNDASVVVWVSEKIRDEHRQALEWLNQRTDTETQFFAVVVELLQIDKSKLTPVFKLVVFPNEWQKYQKQKRLTDVSPKQEKYRIFFQELIDELRDKYNFTKNFRSNTGENRRTVASGTSGIAYRVSFAQGDKARVDLRIYQGQCEKRIPLFDVLKDREEEIIRRFGSNLEWQRNADKQETFIIVSRDGSIEATEDELKEIREWHITNLLKLIEVFQPEIERVLVTLNSSEQEDDV